MKRNTFTLSQVEETLPLKTWWAAVAILPFARITTFTVSNFTRISPNAITFSTCILKLASAGLFATGDDRLIICGGILYELAYMLDCVDGSVARLKKQTSEFGRYFDHLSDVSCLTLNILALAYGQGVLRSPVTISLIYVCISDYYITYIVNNLIERKKAMGERAGKAAGLSMLRPFIAYRRYFFRRNFKSFLSMPDFEALMFLVFPILNMTKLGLLAALYGIIAATFYKIFSSLVTIMINEETFP